MKSLWRSALVLALLISVGYLAVERLELDHRLDAFLPAPKTAQQQVVIDQLETGASNRSILAAIEGASPADLAELSRQTAAAWREFDSVTRVDNGDWSEDPALLDALMRARFVLVDEIAERSRPEAIAGALNDRLADLALAGARAEELIRRDPLGLLEAAAETLSAGAQLPKIDGVWFDAERERALLVVVSAHPAFAIEEQAQLLDALRGRFESVAAGSGAGLSLAGAPVIAVGSADSSRKDAVRLSLWGSALIVLVLAFAWRSLSTLLAGTVPLAFGVVCGLAVTSLAFGQVHGLTLAFGFTLLGVALDYPVHLFGHADRRPLFATVRNIRSPLLLGVASTLIAYGAIWLSASPGLAQLGAFSAAGLAGAALATQFLPALNPAKPKRPAPQRTANLHWPFVPVMLGLGALAWLAWQGEERWSNDLTRLSPVDRGQIELDRELRGALGGGDIRYLLLARAESRDAVLERTELAVEHLQAARDQGLVDRWQAVTTLVPAPATQRERLAAWPSRERLAEAFEAADAGFRSGAFEAFFDDLEAARAAGPISPDFWRDTPLAESIRNQLTQTDTGWRSLIVPVGLEQPQALTEMLAAREAPIELLDLAAGSEAMVAAYRQEAGRNLGIAALIIIGLIALMLRSLRDTVAVVLPPAAAVLVTAAGMSLIDQGLTIVHLIGLLLVAGISLDYSLFRRAFHLDDQARARSRRAINICAVSTGGVFLVLGQSSIGMLEMLGLTVSLGILLSWLFSRIGQPK